MIKLEVNYMNITFKIANLELLNLYLCLQIFKFIIVKLINTIYIFIKMILKIKEHNQLDKHYKN